MVEDSSTFAVVDLPHLSLYYIILFCKEKNANKFLLYIFFFNIKKTVIRIFAAIKEIRRHYFIHPPDTSVPKKMSLCFS